jgi:hypothetical protein
LVIMARENKDRRRSGWAVLVLGLLLLAIAAAYAILWDPPTNTLTANPNASPSASDRFPPATSGSASR